MGDFRDRVSTQVLARAVKRQELSKVLGLDAVLLEGYPINKQGRKSATPGRWPSLAGENS